MKSVFDDAPSVVEYRRLPSYPTVFRFVGGITRIDGAKGREAKSHIKVEVLHWNSTHVYETYLAGLPADLTDKIEEHLQAGKSLDGVIMGYRSGRLVAVEAK